MASPSPAALQQTMLWATAPLSDRSEQVNCWSFVICSSSADVDTAQQQKHVPQGAPKALHVDLMSAGQSLDIKLPMRPRLETLQVLPPCC
jgi:hypothetical protein